jgi:hypothetical protein
MRTLSRAAKKADSNIRRKTHHPSGHERCQSFLRQLSL